MILYRLCAWCATAQRPTFRELDGIGVCPGCQVLPFPPACLLRPLYDHCHRPSSVTSHARLLQLLQNCDLSTIKHRNTKIPQYRLYGFIVGYIVYIVSGRLNLEDFRSR
eukprot:6975264-Prymnesium_polylepis.1